MRFDRLLPLIVACALFIENMDSTVLSTSLPAIAEDLATDPIALKLALTAYLLSLAVFIPVSGWVADRFGARTTFMTAIAVFLLGSIGCAASGSLGALRAGHRRRDDGARRPARATPDRAEERARAGAVLAHDPGARRSGGRSA